MSSMVNQTRTGAASARRGVRRSALFALGDRAVGLGAPAGAAGGGRGVGVGSPVATVVFASGSGVRPRELGWPRVTSRTLWKDVLRGALGVHRAGDDCTRRRSASSFCRRAASAALNCSSAARSAAVISPHIVASFVSLPITSSC